MTTATKEIKMTAKYAGKCLSCRGAIAVGSAIIYLPGTGARHQTCGATTTGRTHRSNRKCEYCSRPVAPGNRETCAAHAHNE